MAFGSFADWAWQAVSLFAGTFVQEDAAIFAGAFLVVERAYPAALAFTSLLSGVIAGDLCIYGLGVLARRWRRLQWVTARFNVERFQRWLNHRLFAAVIISRVMPTLSFPTFAACGWLGVSFRRFALASLASAVVYVSTTFVLLLLFGRSLPAWASTYGWPALGGTMLIVWLARQIVSRRQQKILLSRQDNVEGQSAPVYVAHEGMPPLPKEKMRVALSERIWTILYYTPILFQWLWLSLRYGSLTLPTVANPLIEAGGLIGESKADCMNMVAPAARRWLAASTMITCGGEDGDPAHDLQHVRHAMAAARLEFPVVLKPDIGWRGFGVRRVDDVDGVADYLAVFPPNQRLMIQEYVPYHGEAGVFYTRRPGEANGRIFSLTLRYYPFVVGDGASTLRELIIANSRLRWKKHIFFELHKDRLDVVPLDGEVVRLTIVGSNRVAGLYVDGGRYVTPALTERIDEIAKSIPEFFFGRFDVRFESIEAFQRGEAFSIIEINGAGAEAVHIWDPDVALTEGYRVLFRQQALMFEIGAANRARGFQPSTALELIRCQQRQQRLLPIYPTSG